MEQEREAENGTAFNSQALQSWPLSSRARCIAWSPATRYAPEDAFIRYLSFDFDNPGGSLVLGGIDGKVRLLQQGQFSTLLAHADQVEAVAWSWSDWEIFASISSGNYSERTKQRTGIEECRLWSITPTGIEMHSQVDLLEAEGAGRSVAFHPSNASLLMIADGASVAIYDWTSGKGERLLTLYPPAGLLIQQVDWRLTAWNWYITLLSLL